MLNSLGEYPRWFVVACAILASAGVLWLLVRLLKAALWALFICLLVAAVAAAAWLLFK
jgi:hypothetical protein